MSDYSLFPSDDVPPVQKVKVVPIAPTPTKKVEKRGVLRIGELSIPCFVLTDGTRVISGRGMTQAIGMKGRGQGIQRIPAHRTLKSFIRPELEVAIQNPIYLEGSGSRKAAPAEGYEATILLSLCEAILDARDQGALRTRQELRYAKFCEILVRSFAKVGIIALIDEATGYQDLRPRKALEHILQQFISRDLMRWVSTFPEDFYREIFRLRGWTYEQVASQPPKRPGVVAYWTKDIVYARLAPGVLEALLKVRKKNHKLWQRLTPDVGYQRLKEHLASVVVLMKASPNWETFQRMLARALPRYMETLELFPELNLSETLDESEAEKVRVRKS